MNFPGYKLNANADFKVFQFISVGGKGPIRKIIRYRPTSNPKVYNLGLANFKCINEDEEVFIIDDQAASANGDIDKLIGTIAWSICQFGQHYPDVFVVFGSADPVKRRLCRMIMTKYFTEVTKNFTFFGAQRQEDGKVINVPFYSNLDFDGFFIRLKRY